ncbi:hypothetical protein Y032_0005g2411 [Ancylostoma ceylanicum]|uniref:SCP domain-containing protein n=1 Tax=Ancylostoma ceylanicum TaxID=53326 RepID=A0A016VTJ5_9BILA|nr:hypothetical protein Y032_0005g2411 [Ancylostoma ceylanicum]
MDFVCLGSWQARLRACQVNLTECIVTQVQSSLHAFFVVAALTSSLRGKFYPQGGTADSTILKTFIAGALQYIDYMELEGVNPGDSTVIYKGNSIDSLLPYFTLMQPTATEIGCAYRQCTETTSGLINTYCILNSKQLTEGDVIYNVGQAGVCSNCPSGTGCDPTSNLCVPLASLPTTQPGATTTPSTSTTTPTTTTTTPPPAATTTPPTSSEASFPTGPW